MVRPARCFPAVPLLVLVLGGAALGQTETSLQASPDDGEIDDALRTLDEAGVPPTLEDIDRLLKEDGGGPAAGGEVPAARLLTGTLRYRYGLYPAEGWDQAGKIVVESPWFGLKARVHRYRTGQGDTAGAVRLGRGPAVLRAGYLGLSQGQGLLVGPPGRGGALAADSGLGPGTERMVVWLGSADPRALFGYGAEVGHGSWFFRFLKEGRGGADDDRPGRQTALQLGVRRADWKMSVAGQSSAGKGGVSFAAAGAKGPWAGSLETAVVVPGPGIPAAAAVAAQVKWSLQRGSGLEGSFGFADLAAAPELSSRPAVLPGWAGRGLAVRGFTRTRAGLVLGALLHLGRHRDRLGTPSLNTRSLVDLQVSGRPTARVDASLRLRRDTRRAWEWSARYPWQAPRAGPPEHRTIITAQISYGREKTGGRFMVRTYAVERPEGLGRRSLFGLGGRWDLGVGWQLRGTWVTAWGDPVDLVSAVSPLSGMVLPRHWGHWRSETVLGLERGGRDLLIRGALSVRRPDGGPEGTLYLSCWAEAGIRW